MASSQQLYQAIQQNNTRVVKVMVDHVLIGMESPQQESLLRLAAKLGRVKICRMLLRQGVLLTAADYSGKTALHEALDEGHVEEAILLLHHQTSNQLDIHQKKWSTYTVISEETALLQEAAKGLDEIVGILQERDADALAPESKRYKACTPLHLAARGGHVRVAQALIRHGVPVNIPTSNDVRPLQLGCKHGHLEMARFLINSGANLDLQDKKGHYALYEAVNGNHPDIVRYLLSVGGIPECRKMRFLLSISVENNRVASAEALLKHGACIHTLSNLRKYPLLHVAAARAGSHQMIDLLCKHGAVVNATAANRDTALHLAALHGYEAAAERLLAYGAHVDAINNDFKTPLLLCRSINVARVLLDYQADLDALDDTHMTRLHVAVRYQEEEMIQLLLDRGANPNTTDAAGVTPLLWAFHKERYGLVWDLVDHGASPNALVPRIQLDHTGRRCYGDTIEILAPLHYACKVRKTWLVCKLLSHGADVNAPDFYGRTCLGNMICGCRYPGDEDLAVNLVQWLLDHGLDVNLPDRFGGTTFWDCIENDYWSTGIVLLKGGYVDVHTPSTRSGLTLLEYCCLQQADEVLWLTLKLLYAPGRPREPTQRTRPVW